MAKSIQPLKRILTLLLHLSAIVFLTLVTQIGGLIYLISMGLIKRDAKKKRLKRTATFSVCYLLATFLIVPLIAPVFGREKIKETEFLRAHSFLYKLANRNYVKPELNSTIGVIAAEFDHQNQGIKMVYLDANFPFIDKFPLLPHLSHNDGKKIDVSLVYAEPDGQLTNKKPSRTGYGVHEGPRPEEYDQAVACRQQGYWQYDFPKYLTLGRINKEITFSAAATKYLANLILKQEPIGKLFIEPHLKTRLGLTNDKVRFHGCRAVRHDDHIHFQLQ